MTTTTQYGRIPTPRGPAKAVATISSTPTKHQLKHLTKRNIAERWSESEVNQKGKRGKGKDKRPGTYHAKQGKSVKKELEHEQL